MHQSKYTRLPAIDQFKWFLQNNLGRNDCIDVISYGRTETPCQFVQDIILLHSTLQAVFRPWKYLSKMKDVPKCLQCCQRLIALSRFSKKALRNDFVIHCQHRLNDAIVLASFFITRMAIILPLNKSFPKRSIVVCLHGCNIAVFFEKFITEAIFENSHYPNRFWRFEGDHVKSALCEG